MKSLPHIEKIVKKPEKFSLNNIADSIFRLIQPQVKITPFFDLKDPYLRRNSLTFSLYIFDKGDKLIPSLAKSLDGDYEKNIKDLKELPPWMLSLIHDSYQKEISNWIDYLFDNITEFCEKDSESLINWSSVDKGGIFALFSGKLTFEQKLWMSVQSKLNKNELQKFIIDVKDSLLPWLNNELFKKVQDAKENTRENIAYDEQRKKLQEGKLEDLDVIG